MKPPLVGFVATLVLQDTMVSILTPCIEVLPVPVIAQLIVARLVMYFKEKKMLDRFIRLGPLRFSSAPRENAHELLVSCMGRLHNLGLVESHKVRVVRVATVQVKLCEVCSLGIWVVVASLVQQDLLIGFYQTEAALSIVSYGTSLVTALGSGRVSSRISWFRHPRLQNQLEAVHMVVGVVPRVLLN
ncbi:hypothetical protein HAX54_034135 [Datura stramonium]|uniref:Uncharacterized protein n=1 Tax=Datura stramonium TaxID=4076 RepID=A0ABS8SE83_DATST|nr:hypothetical protein [Datura stramonium]